MSATSSSAAPARRRPRSRSRAFAASSGSSPGFLTRGYRGEEKGPALVSLVIHSAADVGDEALLLGAVRADGGRRGPARAERILASLGADVVVMDDGFQNPLCHKDLTLVVVDGARGVGNGFSFPAGPLRAPLATQIAQPTRWSSSARDRRKGRARSGARRSVRCSAPIPNWRAGAALKRRPYLAFAGHRRSGEVLCVAHRGRRGDRPHHGLSRPPSLHRRRLRDNPGGGEEPRPCPDHDREGPRAAEPARRGRGRLAAGTETLPVRIRFEEPRRLTTLITDAVASHASPYRRSPVISRGGAPVPA